MPIRAPSPYSNRFGSALIIAFFIHVGLLVLLSLHLASSTPVPVPPAATEIQASLVAAETPAEAPAAPPQVSTPSAPKPKPAPTPKPAKPVATVAPAKPIDTQPAPPIIPIIDDTANTAIVSKPPPSKHVTKMKQQTLKQALEQESQQQEQQSPPAKAKPVDKQLLADAMISEIAAEAKASAAKPAATTAKATSSASSTEVNRFKTMILQQIQQNWIVPQHVEHLSCELKVELAPGGTVLKVTLLKSSGNDALDRSAISAINKASPLPTPTKSADFDAFRSFTITVKPEGSSFDEL